jgi:hypothetical protein
MSQGKDFETPAKKLAYLTCTETRMDILFPASLLVEEADLPL